MNNCILIQQVYPDLPDSYAPMLELTRERNQAYCDRWEMDFLCFEGVSSYEYGDVVAGGWCKIELIRDALARGYEYVIWLDADAMIKDLDTDLRDGCIDGIGACWQRIPQLHHWNVGALYAKNVPGLVDFLNAWLGYYPAGVGDGWKEQGVFNKLGRESRLVQTVSDRWNATLNYSMVPDAVVLGFHGYGDTQQRFEAMKETLSVLDKVTA